MKGPDDLPPVQPREIDPSGGSRRARWDCPRCGAENSSELFAFGPVPAICRHCFDAVTLSGPPQPLKLDVSSVWLSVMPDGTRIEIRPHDRGGHRYDVENGERTYGGYDSSWNRHDAYEVALRAIQSRKKRR